MDQGDQHALTIIWNTHLYLIFFTCTGTAGAEIPVRRLSTNTAKHARATTGVAVLLPAQRKDHHPQAAEAVRRDGMVFLLLEPGFTKTGRERRDLTLQVKHGVLCFFVSSTCTLSF